MNLALGTVQFGLPYGISNKKGQIPFLEAKEIVGYARDIGIKCIDTAIAYGDSEEVLGRIGVDGFKVITKLPKVPTDFLDKKKWITESVESSLRRLKVQSLYGLLLHSSHDLSQSYYDELLESVTDLKRNGKIQKFGISIYHPNELNTVYDPSIIKIVQSPMNVIDREIQKSGWLTKLKKDGCEIHSRSVFLQGLLLMEENQRPEKFSKWNNIWNIWKDFLVANKISATAACFGFIKSVKEIDHVIVGVESRQQLREIQESLLGACDCFPDDIASDDQDLINPSNWDNLN